MLFVRSRGCGKADNEGNIEGSKSKLTFPYEQALWQDYYIGHAKCVWVVVVAEVGGHEGLHFKQANGRGKNEPLFKALVTILSNWQETKKQHVEIEVRIESSSYPPRMKTGGAGLQLHVYDLTCTTKTR